MPKVKKNEKPEKTPVAKAMKAATRRKRKHKPKDFPKRPLSAYNIFFKETREKILSTKKDIDFQEMAKEIAAQWKELPAQDRERMDALAKEDMKRYREQVEKYEKEMVKKSREQRDEVASLEERASPEPPAAPQESIPSPKARKPAAVAEPLPQPPSAAAAAAASSSMMHPSMMGALEMAMRNQEEMRFEQLLAAHQQELRERQLLEELQAMQVRDMQMRQIQQQMAAASVPNESYLVSQLRAQQARAGASGLGGGLQVGNQGLAGLFGQGGLGGGLGSQAGLGLNQAALYQANLEGLQQQAMLRDYIQRYGA